MWRRVDLYVCTNVSEEYTASLFRDEVLKFTRCHYPEDYHGAVIYSTIILALLYSLLLVFVFL
jgi:hypothetical protein